MTCAKLAFPSIPTLPNPLTLTLTPPTPPTLGDLDFCCKLPPFPIPIPPLPIPSLVLNSGVLATLNTFIALMNTYINALPLKCPIE